MGPEPHLISQWPASWYLFGAISDIAQQPVTRELLGKRLVAFRSSEHEFAVLDAQCSHMSADLGRGCVVQGRLRCPYHHWEYDRQGRCVIIPTQPRVPTQAQVTSFPCEVRHGYLFFFNGHKPYVPLPFFPGMSPDELVASPHLFPLRFDLPWYFLPGNAFDGQHFASVHDRRLLSPLEVDSPEPMARRVRFRAEVLGDSIFDRLLRRFVGREVRISITSHGGPYVLVKGEFARATSYILVACRSVSEFESVAEVVVFAPRRRSRLAQLLWQPVTLALRRWFTRGFMSDDAQRLSGLRYDPRRMIASDREFTEFLDWLTRLPQTSEGLSSDDAGLSSTPAKSTISFK